MQKEGPVRVTWTIRVDSHLPLPHLQVLGVAFPTSLLGHLGHLDYRPRPQVLRALQSQGVGPAANTPPRRPLLNLAPIARPFPAPSRPGSAPSRSPTSSASGSSLRLRVRSGAEVGARGGWNGESGGRYSQWEAALASGWEAGPARVLG